MDIYEYQPHHLSIDSISVFLERGCTHTCTHVTGRKSLSMLGVVISGWGACINLSFSHSKYPAHRAQYTCLLLFLLLELVQPKQKFLATQRKCNARRQGCYNTLKP